MRVVQETRNWALPKAWEYSIVPENNGASYSVEEAALV